MFFGMASKEHEVTSHAFIWQNTLNYTVCVFNCYGNLIYSKFMKKQQSSRGRREQGGGRGKRKKQKQHVDCYKSN
jgi:hypothetical protein